VGDNRKRDGNNVRMCSVLFLVESRRQQSFGSCLVNGVERLGVPGFCDESRFCSVEMGGHFSCTYIVDLILYTISII